ncbi:hypothetical protein L3X38_036598 [Prunus dulcis]|uniref:Uncharacterized protein n=1 Tax=Prunus dulcis TaxID=3755 RepID=A0AAD4V3M2_PRUDU|nr:hypothetical protein L3X38_036598 [Prunus dulcis]
MGLVDIATKLNRLKIPIDPTYLVHIAFYYLPYDHMKSTYNTMKEDWAMDDLITIVVLEENRTKAYGGVVNMVTAKKYENKGATKWEVKKQNKSQKNRVPSMKEHSLENDICKRLDLGPNMAKVYQALNIHARFREWRWLLNKYWEKTGGLPPAKDVERWK